MNIKLPPMNIISDNERIIPIIMGGKPRAVSSPRYKKCKNELIRQMILQRDEATLHKWNSNIRIKIIAHTYKDITNISKIIVDSLEKAGIIENDRCVTVFLMVKIPIKRG